VSNDYYENTDHILVSNTVALAADVEGKFSSVESGFEKLPSEESLNRGTINAEDDSGTADAYVVTLEQTAAAYVDLMEVTFRAANANTGASTLNVDGVGVKSIKKSDGTALAVGYIPSGGIVTVRWDDDNDYFVLLSASAKIATDAAASALAAAASETAAGLSETAAGLSETAAASSASSASSSATAAETAETNAETAETNAETAETNAETAETNAETAETNAGLQNNYAEEWAQKAEDSAVSVAAGGGAGEYSALHHSAKASAQRVLAETAKTDAETAQSAAETAETNAETAETNAETAETNAETAETNAETAETNAADSAAAAAASAASIAGVNSNITSMTGLSDDGIPLAKVATAIGTTLTEAQNCADQQITRPYFKDSAETTQALGSLSSNTAVSLAAGNIATCTIAGALTFSFTNPPATGRTGILILEITNGAADTITWPASVEWTDATAPTLQSAGVDKLTFTTNDAGTTWLGAQTYTRAT